VREQTEWMLGILGDPDRTGLVVVTTPEEMPITETVELVEKVRTTTDVDVAAVVVNRVLPRWFEGREEAVFDSLCAPPAQEVLARAVGVKVATVFDAARLAEARRVVAEQHLDRLRTLLPREVPVVQVPELFTKASGSRVVSLVADELDGLLP
jgi:anion-transporting  ArsA/GET3 family ATPase